MPWHESSYDNFHEHVDRLYRVNYQISLAGGVNAARTFPTLGPKLTEYFPEMEAAARMYRRDLSVTVVGTEQQLELNNAFFADSTITQVFAFDFLHGNPDKALDRPFSVVLTDKTAEMLFGRVDVLGGGAGIGGRR